jgi:hypothetical protein
MQQARSERAAAAEMIWRSEAALWADLTRFC